MKKLIYSLAIAVMGFASCTTWEDPKTENYGNGPAITVDVTATTDSAFTITLTPASGTQYYNYIIDENDESEELDATTLLKGGYGNSGNLQQVTENSNSFTVKVPAEPNTTYQVYAVAASDKGIVGDVAVATVTTTDVNAPAFDEDPFEPKSESKSVDVWFDQQLIRGDGAVSAIYYKEWDWENPVTVPADEIEVTVDGAKATFAAPTTPDGAIVCFSWAAGAFVDAKGNKCGAFTTTYNEEEDEFVGAYVENKKVPFEIADSYFKERSSAFKFPEQFKGVAAFDFDIFRIDDNIKSGDVSVTYTNDLKSTTIKLDADQWSVAGKQLTFVLPEGIEDGDVVTVSIAEGIIYDVYGNPNAAFDNSEVWWKYVTMTVEEMLGTYSLVYVSYWSESGTPSDMGTFTIELNEAGNGLVIKDFFLEGSKLDATYDLATKSIAIPDGQVLGMAEDEDGQYGLAFVTADGTDAAVFTFDLEAGTFTPTGLWGVYAYDTAFEEEVDWWDVAATSVFTKSVAAESRKLVGKKATRGTYVAKKVVAPKDRSLTKRIRK